MIALGITDSSPIIALNGINRLDLLDGHFTSLIAPEAVAEEVGIIPEWITVTPIKQPRVIDIFPSSIHKGEAAVIALALENPEAVLVLDDWHAREFVRRRHFKMIGTIGLILRAHQQGRIEKVTPILNQLEEAGFRMSRSVLAEAIHLAGEC